MSADGHITQDGKRLHDYLVRLAMEAFDGTMGGRLAIETAVRERMAQAAQCIVCEVAEIEAPQRLDIANFFDAKAAWSMETFGPGDRYVGVIDHIRKELLEVAEKPSDLTEWVDVVLLAMDGAWRSAGADGQAFADAMISKDIRNRGRSWPDWRTLKPGEVSEHIGDDAEVAS